LIPQGTACHFLSSPYVPRFGRTTEFLRPRRRHLQRWHLVSELIGGVSDSQGLCQPAEGGGTATSPVVFRYQAPRSGTAVGHSVAQTTVPVNFSRSPPRSCSEHCRNCPAQSICTCSVTINSIFSARLNRSGPQGSPIEETCWRNMNTPAELLVPASALVADSCYLTGPDGF
jgi:hypothetical protein